MQIGNWEVLLGSPLTKREGSRNGQNGELSSHAVTGEASASLTGSFGTKKVPLSGSLLV